MTFASFRFTSHTGAEVVGAEIEGFDVEAVNVGVANKGFDVGAESVGVEVEGFDVGAVSVGVPNERFDVGAESVGVPDEGFDVGAAVHVVDPTVGRGRGAGFRVYDGAAGVSRKAGWHIFDGDPFLLRVGRERRPRDIVGVEDEGLHVACVRVLDGGGRWTVPQPQSALGGSGGSGFWGGLGWCASRCPGTWTEPGGGFRNRPPRQKDRRL